MTPSADYAYRPDGSVGTVTRFAGAGINPIGTSTAAYDTMGRLTGITHAPAASPAITYGYDYDAASRIIGMTTPEGTSSFTLDATDQLISASLTGEAYAYDKTGNRTSGGTQTGTGNRLLSDGTYRYAYDAEGNRTAKFVDTYAGGTLSVGDTDVTVYAYDQRNRLVAVSHVTAWTSTQAAGLAAFTVAGTPLPGSDLELRSTYDYADRRIRKSLDGDGQAGAGQEAVSFAAYAGDVRTLEIARPADRLVINTATGQVIGFLGQVVQRTFYGNGVDEILAVDRVNWNGTTPTTSTFWTFTDHQDSVRDIVSGNAADRGQVVEHRQYDSFGKVVRRTTGPQAGAATTAGVGVEFAYAGRPFEARTGLSDNRARWYEPATERFVNEDPSGFKGGDANLFRYVGNDPLNQVDPSGLAAKWASGAKASVPAAGWAALGQVAVTTSGSRLGSVSATPVALPTAVARSPYQRVYRTEVETIKAPAVALPSIPAVGSLVPSGSLAPWIHNGRTMYGQDGKPVMRPGMVYDLTRPPDANAWVDRAGRTWSTDQGEISAFGRPPSPPTWGQLGNAAFSVLAALASRRAVSQQSAVAVAARTGRGPFGYPSAVSTGPGPVKIAVGSGARNPSIIRFSQDSARRTFSDGRSIDELVEGLQSGRIKPGDVPPIRLVDREWYLISIDNRRLEAFRRAGVGIPTRMATPAEIEQAIRQGKFSAGPLGSPTIHIRGDNP
jgi:RHS repeat-associated protein